MMDRVACSTELRRCHLGLKEYAGKLPTFCEDMGSTTCRETNTVHRPIPTGISKASAVTYKEVTLTRQIRPRLFNNLKHLSNST